MERSGRVKVGVWWVSRMATNAGGLEWLMPLAPWESSERLVIALESLCRQTWPACRLVVSVDGQLPENWLRFCRVHIIPVLAQSPARVLVPTWLWSFSMSMRMGSSC